MTKEQEYTVQLVSLISKAFDEESDCNVRINTGEFRDPKNLTAFIYALSVAAPAIIFNELTGDDKNLLEFNHLTNTLVFQFFNDKEEQIKCRCEMPAKIHGKNICWRCKRSLSI